MPDRLSPDQVARALRTLPGWTVSPDGLCLQRDFVFPDFSAAFAFMARVAPVAERLNHHPDWCNSYQRVQVRLSTHDAGGLTALDVALAEAMQALAAP